MPAVAVEPIEPNAERFLTVRGIVAPSDWDLDDQVSEVTIYTKSEEEYIVNARASVKQLMKYFDEEVEVTGYLSEDEYGTEVLIVSDLKPLAEAPSEEEWEDENEDWGEDEDEDDEWDDDEWDDDSEEDQDWKRFQDR